MRHGKDFAFGSPGDDGAALAAEGLFVGRYVPYLGDGGKGLKAVELADYRAHGVDLFLYWQTTADYILTPAHAPFHAKWALESLAQLGLDDTGAIYFVADFDAQPAHYPAIADYLRGVATVLPKRRIGFYGHDRVCAYVFNLGLAQYFCQCRAWSGSPARAFAMRNLYQLPSEDWNGHRADPLEAYTTDFGQWPAEGLSVEDRERLARLERIIAGNGIAKDLAKPDERTTGEEALAYADERGWSAFLGLGLNQVATEKAAQSGGKLAPGTKFKSEVIE